MKINHKLLRRQREQRAWTQNQLAEVASLSMRTVQRIERNGIAAKESAMALASALDMDLADLLIQSNSGSARHISHRRWWGLVGILTSLIVSLGWWSTAAAEQVMINLSVKAESGASTEGEMQFLNELGAQSEVRFNQQFRLLVTAVRQNQGLLLSTEIYDFIDGDYLLISSPSILIADNELAAIHVDTHSSGRLQLSFKSDF
ncbi:helix-turn-helix domain-containing protein [Cellvibrio sp. QJXJ]|uniref:helix-turn-helix domain-containing protein n=1 Tax=Cellvibrio sp. QJXJ TaxID=2964606 RepID=UPI0021C460A0|nr:helix-turn-helix domain-containing protein [Cellvibrio sp. QJXJ]UUA72688.1 helix-turn-helix domain-containing protein [Cellvibrio sp. QJXJ]